MPVPRLEFMNNRGHAGLIERLSDIWYEPVVTLPMKIVIVLYTSTTAVTPFAQLPELYDYQGFQWSPACTLHRTDPDDEQYCAHLIDHLLRMWLIAGGKLRAPPPLLEPQNVLDRVPAHLVLVPVGRRTPENTAPPRDVATAREHQQASTVIHIDLSRIGNLSTPTALTPTKASPVNPTVVQTGDVETVPTQASPNGLASNVATSSAPGPPPETPEKKCRHESTEFSTPTSPLGISSAVPPTQASPFYTTGNVATSPTPTSSLGTSSVFALMHALHSDPTDNVAPSSTPTSSLDTFSAPSPPQAESSSRANQALVHTGVLVDFDLFDLVANTCAEFLGAPTPTQAESSSSANQVLVHTGVPVDFDLFDLVANTFVELLGELQKDMFRRGCRGNLNRVWTIIKEVFVEWKNRWAQYIRPEKLEAWEMGMKFLEGKIDATLWKA